MTTDVICGFHFVRDGDGATVTMRRDFDGAIAIGITIDGARMMGKDRMPPRLRRAMTELAAALMENNARTKRGIVLEDGAGNVIVNFKSGEE